MRILSVNNSSDLYGASRCLERVFTRLQHEGHAVFVVLPTEGPLASLLREAGVRVLLHPGLAIVDRTSLRSVIGAIAFLIRWPLSALYLTFCIVRYRIDLVHTNTAVTPSPALGALLTRRPHVWHVREFFGEFGAVWKLYQLYMAGLSSSLIAISKSVRDQFRPDLQGKVAVIYDGLPPEFTETKDLVSNRAIRRQFGIKENTLIGVIGRIKWIRKGQEVVVTAFSQLKNKFPDTHLVIIGSTSEGNADHLHRLIELTKATETAERVTFTGDLDATGAVYSAMSITVVPSVQPEPFGCVVMESMACGTAVVGSNCGGIAEQIVDGESGLLFEPGNPERLAECLARLITDHCLRLRLAEGGRQRVEECFRIEHTVDAMQKLFTEALG